MKKLIFCLTILASLATFAGSAEPDGTDFVVTADVGETYTVSTAIGDYARLVKRGAGEVVLTAKTTAFTPPPRQRSRARWWWRLVRCPLP